MKQFIMTNSTTATYAQGFSYANRDLATGAFAILDGNSTVTKSSTTLKSTLLSIVLGDNSGKFNQLATIDCCSDIWYTESPYQAGTKRSIEIDFTNAITSVGYGDVIGLTFIRKGMHLDRRSNYYAEAMAVNNDVNTVLVKRLAADLQRQIRDMATVAVDGTGLKITITGGTESDFEIARSHGSILAVQTNKAVFAPTINDAKFVEDIWLSCIGNDGNYDTDPNGINLHKKPVFNAANKTLNLFFKSPRSGRQTPDENVIQQIIFTFPDTAAQYADFKAAIDKIITLGSQEGKAKVVVP